jgi:hypothetical protein
VLDVLGMVHAFVCAHDSLPGGRPQRLTEQFRPRKSKADCMAT